MLLVMWLSVTAGSSLTVNIFQLVKNTELIKLNKINQKVSDQVALNFFVVVDLGC